MLSVRYAQWGRTCNNEDADKSVLPYTFHLKATFPRWSWSMETKQSGLTILSYFSSVELLRTSAVEIVEKIVVGGCVAFPPRLRAVQEMDTRGDGSRSVHWRCL